MRTIQLQDDLLTAKSEATPSGRAPLMSANARAEHVLECLCGGFGAESRAVRGAKPCFHGCAESRHQMPVVSRAIYCGLPNTVRSWQIPAYGNYTKQ